MGRMLGWMEEGLECRRGFSSGNGDEGSVGANRGCAVGLGMYEPTRGVGRIEEGSGGFRM